MASLMGEVDLLGLDAFGNNPGMDALHGTLIGGGISYVVDKIATKSGKDGNVWGFGAGILASAALYWHWKTRHAALGALAGAFLASGADWLLGKLFGTKEGTAGHLGLVQPVALNGLGLVQPVDSPPVYGANNLGLVDVNNVPYAYGVANNAYAAPPMAGLAGPGIAGPQLGQAPPVDLLGEPTAQSQQLQLLGGPAVSGLASAYGATLLGGNN